MKFGRIVHQENVCRLTESLHCQDGDHDVRPPLATAYAAVSAGCPLACQGHVAS